MKLPLMVFCLIVCLASPSFPLDPYKTNVGGFGPRVAGTKLGMKMSLRDIVRWRANLRGVPFILDINSDRAVERKPSETGSISLLFTGKDKEITGFRIVSAGKKFSPLRSSNMKLPDLLAEIENIGVDTVTLWEANKRVRDNCISFTDDRRVASVRVRKSDYGAGNMSHESFVREFTRDYSLPEMRRRGNVWDYRNVREGWRITYHALGDGIFVLEPVITE